MRNFTGLWGRKAQRVIIPARPVSGFADVVAFIQLPMAHDEYEVARLHTDGAALKQSKPNSTAIICVSIPPGAADIGKVDS